MGLHEIKNFCTTTKKISQLKRPPKEWEKIVASYTSDKGVVTNIYRELRKLTSHKFNDPIKNGPLNCTNFFKGRNPNG
jgi:hypothetical protein